MRNVKRKDASKSRPRSAESESSDSIDAEKREQKRLVLRTAAYKRFSERGYHLTTVDDICEEARISKGSFYWYYDSKQSVLLAIVEGWSHDVEVALTEHFRSTIKSANRRAAVSEGLQALSRKLSRLMPLWLEFLAHAQREPAIREGLQNFHRRVRRATHSLLCELVNDFESDKESAALATIIVGGFIGLMALELSDPSEVTFAREVDAFMHLLGHSSIDAHENKSPPNLLPLTATEPELAPAASPKSKPTARKSKS